MSSKIRPRFLAHHDFLQSALNVYFPVFIHRRGLGGSTQLSSGTKESKMIWKVELNVSGPSQFVPGKKPPAVKTVLWTPDMGKRDLTKGSKGRTAAGAGFGRSDTAQAAEINNIEERGWSLWEVEGLRKLIWFFGALAYPSLLYKVRWNKIWIYYCTYY